jgi:hypothetical protein
MTSDVMQPVGRPFPNEEEKDRRFHSVLEGTSQKGVDYLRTAKSGTKGERTARVSYGKLPTVRFTVTGDREVWMVCMLWWCRRVRKLNRVEFRECEYRGL